jgi:hypothetical protein
MPSHRVTGVRSLEVVEGDFYDLVESRVPVVLACEIFERLWDEVNSIVAQDVSATSVTPYILLLKRMQELFDARYLDRLRINGNQEGPH